MAERLLVLWHGLSLDMTVAGYVTALPLLATLASLWCRCPTGCGAACSGATSSSCRSSRRPSSPSILRSTATGGFRIDATILIYLSDPKGALASIGAWGRRCARCLVRAPAGVMTWVYDRVVRLFSGERVRLRLAASGVLLFLAGGLCFPGDPRRRDRGHGQRLESLFQRRYLPEPCGDQPRVLASLVGGRRRRLRRDVPPSSRRRSVRGVSSACAATVLRRARHGAAPACRGPTSWWSSARVSAARSWTRAGGRRGGDAQHAALPPRGVWFGEFLRQFVPHGPRRGGGAERVSRPDPHVGDETPGPQPGGSPRSRGRWPARGMPRVSSTAATSTSRTRLRTCTLRGGSSSRSRKT